MKIAIMGFGVVGSGVYEVIESGNDSIAKRAGEPIEIKHILDLRDFPDHERSEIFTKSFDDIINDSEIELVAEVIGGLNPAYDYTKRLLTAGKSVVTSNKELVACHGTELLELAAQNGAQYMFEASVGGGIPIIRPINSCLAANSITDIMGILNGTTNYILTRMIKDNQSFEEALAGAQERGYAERDPSADIEGKDTCRKIAILASLAFERFVNSDEIPTEGITKITLEDVVFAESQGKVIKLVGMASKVGDKVFAKVCPVMMDKSHPLAGVEDVFNGVLLHADNVGDVLFYGRGAGKLPTASAVVADIIDVMRHKNTPQRKLWSGTAEVLPKIPEEVKAKLSENGITVLYN
ncbi:MAG: homoserine dehydrogenase [Oscillospiraceae bacterium]|nr:homoserine dehydrogenase [Oscillospiraceae bacterium]